MRLRQSESPSELRLRFSSEDFSVLMTVLPVVEGGGGGRDSEDSRSLSGEAEGGGRRERLRVGRRRDSEGGGRREGGLGGRREEGGKEEPGSLEGAGRSGGTRKEELIATRGPRRITGMIIMMIMILVSH